MFLILEIDLCGLLAPSSQWRVGKFTSSGDWWVYWFCYNFLIWSFPLGCPEEWQREKLSWISVPKAQISHHLLCSPRMVCSWVRACNFIASPNPTSAQAAGNSLVFGGCECWPHSVDPPTCWFCMHHVCTSHSWRGSEMGASSLKISRNFQDPGSRFRHNHWNCGEVPKPNNFANAFQGTTASASSFFLSLYNVCRFPSREYLI